MTDFGMPHMYEVNIGTYKNTAKVLRAFLTCPHLKKREVGIFNKDHKKRDPGYLFPQDLMMEYTDKKIPEASVLEALLENNGYGFSAVAAFDNADTKRVTLTSTAFTNFMPGKVDDPEFEELKKELEGKMLLNSFCPEGYADKISRVIEYLESAAK